jgi:hypothetical protein
MHTKLQARVLEQLYKLIPDNCQLWITTHSIGMARKAYELMKENPEEVQFIDFHEHAFDQPVALKPIQPDRDFWKRMFETALDDLACLVVPRKVVFCEGKHINEDKDNTSFDANVYSKIFNSSYPEIDFVSLGGDNQLKTDSKLLSSLVLKKLASGIETLILYDRDDRSDEEIIELKNEGARVLQKRDLESYLWEDEVLLELAKIKGRPEKGVCLVEEKQRLLTELPGHIPKDDIKKITGPLYNFCKKELELTGCGNNAETLAPLIIPGTNVYEELEGIIFK